MARETLPITPAVLTWARVRSGYSLDDLKPTFRAIEDWESGVASPTYSQLEQLAQRLALPIAVFFFPEPPKVEEIRESFRTLPDSEFELIPRRVKRMLRKAKAMQLNLLELNDGRGPRGRLIISDVAFSPKMDVAEMAKRVRDYLGITIEQQLQWRDADVALDHWRSAVAAVGVFVFKDAFRVDEYSGFCLYDDAYPLIYINNSTSKTRQIFTLFHELAHLLFHTSGIDTITDEFINALPLNERTIEIVCNRFAAAFLVPDAEFTRAISGAAPTMETAETLARQFCVSREVIFRKFLDRSLISQADYEGGVEFWRSQHRSAGGGGGDYYNTQMAYLGADYIRLAFQNYYQNRINETQLSEYLNIAPRNLGAFETRFSRRAS